MRKRNHQERAGKEAHAISPYPEAATGNLPRCDWAIIRTLERVGLATSVQLERLHFHAVPAEQRGITCQDTLQRLVDLRVLAIADLSINHAGDGLPTPTYSLRTAGSRLVQTGTSTRVRYGKTSHTVKGGSQRVAGTLASTQLFVDLIELDRAGDLSLEAFRTGTASQWPDGLGGTLDPDAFIRVARGNTTDFWWLVVDREPDWTALMLAKARAYLDFRRREEPGPDGVMPRVLIGALTKARAGALQFMLDGLPEHARQIFVVTRMPDAVDVITKRLGR